MNGPKQSPRILSRVGRGCAISVATVAAALPNPAFAQQDTAIMTEETPYKGWLLVALASVLFVGIVVKNPKRTHRG